MSFYQLLQLEWRKTIRSVSADRKLLSSILLGIFGLIALLYLLGVGIGLTYFVGKAAGQKDVALFINRYVIFFFLLEMMYRYFLQTMSTIDLEKFLHLPIGRPRIIRFLLSKSFISAFNIVVILLFAPSYFMQVGSLHGVSGGLSWLFTLIFISWAVHWLMIWFQQKFGEGFTGIAIIFVIFLVSIGSAWYGWFNIGRWVEPFFNAALDSPFPIIIAAVLMTSAYFLTYRFYYKHAYLEELSKRKDARYLGDSFSLFSRFGLPGAIADLELKLVLRHKRSRMALVLSAIFLAYGLIFYNDGTMDFSKGIPAFAIFIGTFITGIFIMQYGRLFISWNSAHFDFYLDRNQGINALIEGKYILFVGVSVAAYLLSIPYVYFGWNILLAHTATFLFNIGISMHAVIYIALWKPKPMDINKGAMFNYEGVGAAQFLIAIPMMLLPYAIYLPLAYFVSDYAGLAALALLGVGGLIFYNQFVNFQVHRVRKHRYAISSSFRREL